MNNEFLFIVILSFVMATTSCAKQADKTSPEYDSRPAIGILCSYDAGMAPRFKALVARAPEIASYDEIDSCPAWFLGNATAILRSEGFSLAAEGDIAAAQLSIQARRVLNKKSAGSNFTPPSPLLNPLDAVLTLTGILATGYAKAVASICGDWDYTAELQFVPHLADMREGIFRQFDFNSTMGQVAISGSKEQGKDSLFTNILKEMKTVMQRIAARSI